MTKLRKKTMTPAEADRKLLAALRGALDANQAKRLKITFKVLDDGREWVDYEISRAPQRAPRNV